MSSSWAEGEIHFTGTPATRNTLLACRATEVVLVMGGEGLSGGLGVLIDFASWHGFAG